MNTYSLDAAKIRDIAPQALDADGRLRVLPAAYWAGTTPEERALFGHRHGLYSYPTSELVDYLRALIGGRDAIEIGAGHGVLAQALSIVATDNRMQEKEPFRTIYARSGQPTVQYGPNVIDCPADQAVRTYRPKVVIGCWVTHKYDETRPWAGGNMAGIDEEDVLAHCDLYVVVGNEHVHRAKKIWGRPHRVEFPPFVFSRSLNGSREFVATWRGRPRNARSGRSSAA